MIQYYLHINDQDQGPYSLEELAQLGIEPGTYVWKNGQKDWQLVEAFPELQKFIRVEDSPVSPVFSAKDNYSKVEDIAGVNYKYAYVLTGIFLVYTVLFNYWSLNLFGNLMITGLAITIWYYFKMYFDALNDRATGKFIWGIIAGYCIYFATLLMVTDADFLTRGQISLVEIIIGILYQFFTGEEAILAFTRETIRLIEWAMFLAMLAGIGIMVSGIRILAVNKQYLFPLKRIAISAMIMIPIWMLFHLAEAIIHESETSLTFRVFMASPYIFLFFHFYRADKEDATP